MYILTTEEKILAPHKKCLEAFMDANQSMMLTSTMHELIRGQRSRLAHQGSREGNLYHSPQSIPE